MPTAEHSPRSLVSAAVDVVADLQRAGEDHEPVAARLRDSVIRPLRLILASGDVAVRDHRGPGTSAVGDHAAARIDEVLFELAYGATALLVEHSDDAALGEATAALQDLAVTTAEGSAASARVTELQALQAGLDPRIQTAANGPLLVTNAIHLDDWLGQPLPTRPQMALCRCGASQLKPLCDGSHTAVGFDDAKSADGVADRRDSYVGVQVTIHDNRSICQHSGYCTDRLATVFHLDAEPFVTPSGGRMDEIIRAVRDCPSGALSYAIDGVEARGDADHHGTRAPAIEVSKDGPYRVTGGVPLVDGDGSAITRNHGASNEHYTLCRCGQSQNKPFCSGMHYYGNFRDPVPAPDHQPTLFEWAGGLPALTRMTRRFYETHIPADPLLAPLLANMSADHPQRVAKWLAEVFGGPNWYSTEHGGYPRMLSQHLAKNLTEEQRTRWVTLLVQSAREAGLPNDAEFASAFRAYFEWGSRLAVENSQTNAKPPQHMPMPHWEWNTAAGPPGSRISALAPDEHDDTAGDVVIPEPGQPLSFEQHIKPLFRRRDQQSMQFAFDLWSHHDVTSHADAILTRLQAGTMPCDAAWPDSHTDLFRRWIDADKPN
jgi:CDGSH-type Zn-finger protein/truncated hemoglobin YjbI